MNYVYLVYYEDPHDNDEDLVAVFSTYQKAENYIQKESVKSAGYDNDDDKDEITEYYKKHYRIVDCEVDVDN